MEGQMVTIADMMNCRDRRVQIQSEYIRKYHQPVISFCMNIPGPVKTNNLIKNGFEKGKDELLSVLARNRVIISESVVFHDVTGDEMILSVSAPAEKLKDLTSQIEEEHPYGRLFDMDVIDVTGQKLSRASYRKCLLCGAQAQECARSRKHTVQEMQNKIMKILKN